VKFDQKLYFVEKKSQKNMNILWLRALAVENSSSDFIFPDIRIFIKIC